jgi:hypothetical protein
MVKWSGVRRGGKISVTVACQLGSARGIEQACHRSQDNSIGQDAFNAHFFPQWLITVHTLFCIKNGDEKPRKSTWLLSWVTKYRFELFKSKGRLNSGVLQDFWA